MQRITVGMLGLGTVGAGFLTVLQRNRQTILQRTQCAIKVKTCVVRDVSKVRRADLQGVQLSADPYAVLHDPEIDVVIEVMGGETLARDWVLMAMQQKKQVVTANKALLARHGAELCAQAERCGVTLAFEAAVAGGIPVIKALREGLAGNQIQWLAGIVNGTSNFILTRMHELHEDFSTALLQAQQHGYAEADPRFDVDGIDAAHKLTILAALAFGMPLCLDAVHCEGISQITHLDIAYAEELGYCIKHVAVAQRMSTAVQLRVLPVLLSHRHILAHVNDAMNAVLVYGDAAGASLYYGAGAGAEPTASAVLADVIDLIRDRDSGTVRPRVPTLAFAANAIENPVCLPIDALETVYYLRVHVLDKAGTLADIARILGDLSISIEILLQKKDKHGLIDAVPVVIVTHKAREINMQQAIKQIECLASVAGKVMCLRMEMLW